MDHLVPMKYLHKLIFFIDYFYICIDPNNGTCVEIQGNKNLPGLWYSRDCDEEKSFICKKIFIFYFF